jgi:aryl-alcohol dehydrogenase-like predicted oxidoreductase
MFILGSANFGNEYPGSKVFIDHAKADNILDEFEKIGGRIIDTAFNYGNSHAIISQLNNNRFKIGTKINADLLESKEQSAKALRSLEVMFGKNLKYILLHTSIENVQLSSAAISYLKDYLSERADISFGVSIYYFEELMGAISLGLPMNSVQAPLNYLDRRFIAKEKVEFCESTNIQIYYRSIFLQGRLLRPKNELPHYFHTSDVYKCFDEDVTKYNESRLNTLLRFALKNIQEEQMVFGIESLEQLQNLKNTLDYCKKIDKKHLNFLEIHFNEDICIPMNWKKFEVRN